MTHENEKPEDKRPDTSHLGVPLVSLHFTTGTEIVVWRQDATTYPFLVRVAVGDERGWASGCAIVDGEDFEEGCASLVDSVRLLQLCDKGHVVLDAIPDVASFVQAIAFVAASGALHDDHPFVTRATVAP